MQGKIFLTVIVPIYNKQSTLEKCVHSLLNQTYTNMEIILVNDGSDDNSGEICERLASSNDNITTIHQKNKGVSAARNAGLDNSKGEFIGFVDADDHVSPQMYENLMSLAIDNNADIACCSYVCNDEIQELSGQECTEVFKEANIFISFLRDKLAGKKIPKKCEEKYRSFEGSYIISGFVCDKIFRRSKFPNVRFCENISLAEDTLYVLQTLVEAGTVAANDYKGYNYILTDKSLSRKTNYKILESYYAMSEEYYKTTHSTYPELDDLLCSAYAYMNTAVLNRLLGNLDPVDAEVHSLTCKILENLAVIKKNEYYYTIDPRLKSLIYLCLNHFKLFILITKFFSKNKRLMHLLISKK